MRYTLRNIPADIDDAIRAKAKAERKSLNRTILDVLQIGLALSAPTARKRDLSDLAGSWVEDPAFDQAIAECRQVDLTD